LLFNEIRLLTNATVVDDAIGFASSHQAKEGEEESTARTILEEEQQPATRNQVF
jgi:hypothetical protein